MDYIDTIMLHLAEEVVELKGGKYIAKKKNTYSVALFKHCYEEGWMRALYDGKNPVKKIMLWDFTKLAQGFDFSACLPWKYKKR